MTPPSQLTTEVFKIQPSDSGRRLDHVLAEKLDLSRAAARKLIVAGAVYLNGKRVRIASKTLINGAQIKIHLNREKIKTRTQVKAQEPVLGPEQVLFEDEWIIVFNKPAGLPTQPTLDDARTNLFALAKKFSPYIGLHHRLDRDTSGVILFTKAKSANAPVSQLFAKHLLKKNYIALTARSQNQKSEPELNTQIEFKNYLNKKTGKPSRMVAVRSGGQPAHTVFSILAHGKNGILWNAQPITGRMHQIRVHLADMGYPIVGDFLYAPPKIAALAPRVMLHAASLTFPHPITKTEMVIRSPIPEDFQPCLDQLGFQPGGIAF